MTVLENRVRLIRRECAERQNHVAALEGLMERLSADALRLGGAARRCAEADAAAASLNAEPAPVPPATQRLGKLAGSVADLGRELAAARASLRAAEEALRRYERAAARQKLRRRV
jgi:hypothetical protein